MLISKDLVQRYQNMHKQKFGYEVDDEEAEHELTNLIELVRAMASVGKGKYVK